MGNLVIRSCRRLKRLWRHNKRVKPCVYLHNGKTPYTTDNSESRVFSSFFFLYPTRLGVFAITVRDCCKKLLFTIQQLPSLRHDAFFLYIITSVYYFSSLADNYTFGANSGRRRSSQCCSKNCDRNKNLKDKV